jgi:transcriptional regulator with XRE-family HTH domain
VTKQEVQLKVGESIRQIRLAKGISQRQLAFAAKKDPQSLERVENGKTCPTIFYLVEICEALEVNVKDVLQNI